MKHNPEKFPEATAITADDPDIIKHDVLFHDEHKGLTKSVSCSFSIGLKSQLELLDELGVKPTIRRSVDGRQLMIYFEHVGLMCGAVRAQMLSQHQVFDGTEIRKAMEGLVETFKREDFNAWLKERGK